MQYSPTDQTTTPGRSIALIAVALLVLLAQPLTSQPIRLIKDVRPGPIGCFERDDGSFNELIQPTVAGGRLFFACDDGVHGLELWKSDGTEAGTSLVKDIVPGAGSSFPESKSEDTWFYHEMTPVGSEVFFVASDGVHGYELWKSDGTAAGTLMVADIRPELGYGSVPAHLTEIGGLLYFTVDDEPVHGEELWRSDGTEAGTFMVADICPGTCDSSPSNFVLAGGSVYFRADDGASGNELWTTDGSAAGTQRVSDICPGACSSYPTLSDTSLVVAGSLLYFTADDGVHGTELWRSDGTDVGTSMVKDIFAESGDFNSSYPSDLAPFDGDLFFTADEYSDGEHHGKGLWRTDGTEAGTVRLLEDPPLWYPSRLTVLGNSLFFTGGGCELWKSDGTASGTVRIKSYYCEDAVPIVLTWLTPFDGLLYFTVDWSGIWRSNGTAPGTVEVAPDQTSEWRPAGQELFFVSSDAAHGAEPWLLLRSAALHDQTDGALSAGWNSQEFEPAYTAYDSLAADDFEVPDADRQWDVGEVVVGGAYDTGGGPTPFVNVEIYEDSGGMPGSSICTYDGLAAGTDFTDDRGDFKILLPTPCTLEAGTYWLMAQADMDHGTSGPWWWRTRGLQHLTTFRWMNPGDGYGTGCTAWSAGCGGDASEPDLAFVLRTAPGCALDASDLALSGEALSGTELLEACHSITAGDGTTVDTGSDVVLRAGRRIVLESGFSVDDGTSLELAVDPDLASPEP